MANRQFVIFDICGESFGIDILQVKEITTPMEIYKVPDTPEYVEGLINLRGKVHTIFNLRKRFNLPDRTFDGNTKIIIVNSDSSSVGLIVDEVHEIASVEDKDMEASPETLTRFNRKFIRNVAKKQDKIILILDLDQVLSMA